MVDIKQVRENVEKYREAIKQKRLNLDLEQLLEADRKRLILLQEVEALQSLKNDINDLIREAKNEEERQEIIAKGKEIRTKLESKEPEYRSAQEAFDTLIIQVPTLPSADTPIGMSETDNVEVFRSGEVPVFNFTPKTHIELGKELDILDLERGTKVAGYRGYYVKNEGVSLMLGFMMYAVSKMIQKGYAPMLVPTLVKEFALFGSGYFKGKEYDPEVDEIYQVATSDKEATGEASKDKKFLVGTAEPSLLAYYANETLSGEQLPLKLCGYSQCYRSEIGSYGKDTKGLYRVHEFLKVEQVVLCQADYQEAEKLQNEMLDISREMHQELGLPFRQLAICTGDLGAGKYRQFDLEAWLPGMNRWAETGSASIFGDWQSRRLNVKYEDAEGKKKPVFMLNNTALPSPRIFIAILENYQQADGSVKIPEVLKKFMPAAVDFIKRK
ncbi:serine--tRNA ligase [Patescibacteria group bacterium]|nr:MAG: serine--tRNA ligase [Patescibacteria group bacterium]